MPTVVNLIILTHSIQLYITVDYITKRTVIAASTEPTSIEIINKDLL